jgi:oligopeptidase A
MEHPFLENEFRVHWSRLTPEHIEADILKALDEAQVNIDALAGDIPEELTFENTMLPLEDADSTLGVAWGKVGHLNSVKDSKELREAYNGMLPKVSEFSAKIPLNAGLWKRIKAYSETEEARSLTGIRKRYLDETLSSFKSSGADLSPDNKTRMEEIQAELAKLTQKYSENCLDAINAWEWIVEDEADLSGLPELAVAQALQSAQSKDIGSSDQPSWRFTLTAPSLMPVLKYADKEDLRKTCWFTYNIVGTQEPHDNRELVGQVLALRQEKAELLGFSNFADLVLGRRMAGNGHRALVFENEMHAKIKARFDEESAELDTFRCGQLGIEHEFMEPWDVAYWAEKYRQSKYDFDEEELRPYFPVDRVLNGMFEITQKLFGVTIREAEAIYSEIPSEADSGNGYEVWNDDVKVFELFDEGEAHIGSFYTDWFPRESKRSGAWMNYTLTGDRSGGKNEPHLGQIHGNMSPPTDGKPALLSHRDVETVFHEFGHLIHHLFGDVDIKSLNGVNVAWDFVELPSQILENWCWDRKGLDLFARHYETGETIPDDLFQKMVAAKNFNAASFAMRQLSFGKMDLELHMRYSEFQGKELERELETILEPYMANRKRKVPVYLYNFGHLFSDPTGYAAGYYSYKWAEVLDADAFTRFEKEGLLNAETGKEFKDKILSRGNSEDPLKLFVDFMGREPDPDALLRREGLLSE